MLTRSTMKIGLVSAATALSLVLSLGLQDAQARERSAKARPAATQNANRPARPNVPRGDRSVHTERQRTENGHTSHGTVTGRNGQTATRDATVVNDRDAGTRTRDVTYTGRDGEVRTSNTVTTRTEDGRTSNTTFTNAQGETATRSATVVNDADAGTRTRDVTYTGPNGGVATVNDVTQRTDTGYIRNTTVTGANGETGTRAVTVSCDKAAGNCTKDVTVNDGGGSGN